MKLKIQNQKTRARYCKSQVFIDYDYIRFEQNPISLDCKFDALLFIWNNILKNVLFFINNLLINSTLLEVTRNRSDGKAIFEAIRPRELRLDEAEKRVSWKMRNASDGNHLCARQIFVIILESRGEVKRRPWRGGEAKGNLKGREEKPEGKKPLTLTLLAKWKKKKKNRMKKDTEKRKRMKNVMGERKGVFDRLEKGRIHMMANCATYSLYIKYIKK